MNTRRKRLIASIASGLPNNRFRPEQDSCGF